MADAKHPLDVVRLTDLLNGIVPAIASPSVTGGQVTSQDSLSFGTANDAAGDALTAAKAAGRFQRTVDQGPGASQPFFLPETTGRANFGLLIVTFQRSGFGPHNRTSLWLVGYDGTGVPTLLQIGADLVNGTPANSTFTLAGAATGRIVATYTGPLTGYFSFTFLGHTGVA